jgi:sarcosine oxidase delta subunit
VWIWRALARLALVLLGLCVSFCCERSSAEFLLGGEFSIIRPDYDTVQNTLVSNCRREV